MNRAIFKSSGSPLFMVSPQHFPFFAESHLLYSLSLKNYQLTCKSSHDTAYQRLHQQASFIRSFFGPPRFAPFSWPLHKFDYTQIEINWHHYPHYFVCSSLDLILQQLFDSTSLVPSVSLQPRPRNQTSEFSCACEDFDRQRTSFSWGSTSFVNLQTLRPPPPSPAPPNYCDTCSAP